MLKGPTSTGESARKKSSPLRSARQVAQFGPLEDDMEAGELRKQGMKIRLQEKPLPVLCVLLERLGSTFVGSLTARSCSTLRLMAKQLIMCALPQRIKSSSVAVRERAIAPAVYSVP
jgi:hypothetical protein